MNDEDRAWSSFLGEGFQVDTEGVYRFKYPHEEMVKKFGRPYFDYLASIYVGRPEEQSPVQFAAEYKVPVVFLFRTILPLAANFTATVTTMNVLEMAKLLKERKFTRRKLWFDVTKHLDSTWTVIQEVRGWPLSAGGREGSVSQQMQFTVEDLLADDWAEVIPPGATEFKITKLPDLGNTPPTTRQWPNQVHKIPAAEIKIVKEEHKNPLGLEGAVSLK